MSITLALPFVEAGAALVERSGGEGGGRGSLRPSTPRPARARLAGGASSRLLTARSMLLKQKPAVVCLARPAWDGSYVRSTVRMMRALSAEYRVLYVDYTRVFPGAAEAGRLPRLHRVEDEGEMWVLTPPPGVAVGRMEAGPTRRALLDVNAASTGDVIRDVMEHLGMEGPVVVTAFAPELGLPLVDALGERARVYYGYDEGATAPHVTGYDPGLESEYLGYADAVVVPSAALYASRSWLHPNVHLIPSGFDFHRFHDVAALHNPFSQPSVGFIGTLDGRLDYGLLRAVIERRADLSFRFAGRIASAEAEALGAFPNVVLVEPHGPEEAPLHLGMMDVATVPFRTAAITRNAQPKQLLAYLAAGRPVVATPFAPFGDASAFVRTAADPDGFCRALDAALADTGPAARSARAACARRYTWAERALEFGDVIASVLANAPMSPQLA